MWDRTPRGMEITISHAGPYTAQMVKETGTKTECSRQRVKKGAAAMYSMTKNMFFEL